jgi:AcrR family transcriptional regulator
MGRRATFDAADLAAAGLAVTRRDGWSAVSVASVAGELGVTPMALYRVVPDADALRRAVADLAGAGLLPAAGGGPLLDELRVWAGRAHRTLLGLPGLASYVVREWTELPSWLRVIEAFLGLAEDEGLVGDEAVHTVNAVFSYVLARAQLRETVSVERGLRPLLDDPSTYPHIRANMAHFRTARTRRAFDFGLDALLRGLAVPAPAREVAAGGRTRT